jgi:hypothetical protein
MSNVDSTLLTFYNSFRRWCCNQRCEVERKKAGAGRSQAESPTPTTSSDLRIIFVLEASRHINKARWPSGLRRQLKVVSTSNSLVRKGVGSNPTLVNIFFCFFAICTSLSRRVTTSRKLLDLGNCANLCFLFFGALVGFSGRVVHAGKWLGGGFVRGHKSRA